MGAEEEKYLPNFGKMELTEIQGTAKAVKNMVDRRFKKFTRDIQEVIDAVMYDKDSYQLVKDLRKDVEENIVSYEEILTHLEGLYSAKAKKFPKEIKELTKNFKVMEERRKKQAAEGERRGERCACVPKIGGKDGDKKFKQPTGAYPERISSEFTPLMAENLARDMRLSIKTCSNIDILSSSEQKTLIKQFVSMALWPMVELSSTDSMEVMVH